MTLRLKRETRRRLNAVARSSGRTASDVARRALEGWLQAEEASESRAPYDSLAHLVGCIDGGDPGRSTRGVASIAALLRAKARRRR